MASSTFRPVPKPTGTRRKNPRKRNLSDWRKQVLQRDGRCRACGYRGPADGSHLSAHHLIFKSHCQEQYIDDPRNGLTLCNEWGNGCHQKLHQAKMRIERRWLPKEVQECMAEQGLQWGPDGMPVGTLSSYFKKEEPA